MYNKKRVWLERPNVKLLITCLIDSLCPSNAVPLRTRCCSSNCSHARGWNSNTVLDLPTAYLRLASCVIPVSPQSTFSVVEDQYCKHLLRHVPCDILLFTVCTIKAEHRVTRHIQISSGKLLVPTCLECVRYYVYHSRWCWLWRVLNLTSHSLILRQLLKRLLLLKNQFIYLI